MSEVQPTPTQPASQPAATPAAPELPATDGGAPANADGAQAPDSEPKPDKVNLRFADLTKERNEARIAQARAEERARVYEEMMQKGLGQPQPQPQPQAPAETPDPEPNVANYKGGDFDPQYQKDWARWDNRQQLKAMREEFRKEQETHAQKTAEQTEFQRGLAQFNEAVQICSEYGEQLPNAAPTLRMLAEAPQRGGVGLPNHLVDLITGDDNPHLIASFLHDRPDLMQKMRADVNGGIPGQIRIAAIIGDISGYFRSLAQNQAPANTSPPPQPSANGAPVVPQVTNVPPPVNGSGAGSAFNPDTASQEEYVRWRMGR